MCGSIFRVFELGPSCQANFVRGWVVFFFFVIWFIALVAPGHHL